jgi:hypothetical protein
MRGNSLRDGLSAAAPLSRGRAVCSVQRSGGAAALALLDPRGSSRARQPAAFSSPLGAHYRDRLAFTGDCSRQQPNLASHSDVALERFAAERPPVREWGGSCAVDGLSQLSEQQRR